MSGKAIRETLGVRAGVASRDRRVATPISKTLFRHS